MRILFVHERCGYLGGAEQALADMAIGLSGRGHTCALAYGSCTGMDAHRFRRHFEACFACSDLAPQEASGSTSHRFAEIEERFAPSVLFIHRLRELPPTAGRRARTVRMVHDHEIYCPRTTKFFTVSGRICSHPEGWRCWLDAAFLARNGFSRWTIRFRNLPQHFQELQRNKVLNAYVAVSSYVRDQLILNGFEPDRIHVLNPMPRPMAQAPSPVPDQPNILFVGRLSRDKGADLLLRALRKARCEFTATLVGEGHGRSTLERLTRRLGLTTRVTFKGWVPHGELPRFYAAAKIVVVPSRFPEPFGMVGLEAMMHGRGVVAFDVGGIRDWLESGATGLVAPEQNTSELAKQIERTLTCPELAEQLGREGFKRFLGKFSFDRYLDQLEACLAGAEASGEKRAEAA